MNIPFCDPSPEISIDGYDFNFTGPTRHHSLSTYTSLIECLGGNVVDALGERQGFLVIGEGETSPNHCISKRAVAHAVRLRDEENLPIHIIHERNLFALLDSFDPDPDVDDTEDVVQTQNPVRFRRSELTDRQTAELIGLARGMLSDGFLADAEVEYLQKWLVASEGVVGNPLVMMLARRVEEIMADGIVDEDERADLLQTLTQFTGSDFEVGEALKASTLPLCVPTPEINFSGRRFCFTGTFGFGKRKVCEAAVIERGGVAGSLTLSTDFLVIGEYATDSWAQSSYGRKIEKAVATRTDSGCPAIVSEAHWRAAL